jgi:hypothetical protein
MVSWDPDLLDKVSSREINLWQPNFQTNASDSCAASTTTTQCKRQEDMNPHSNQMMPTPTHAQHQRQQPNVNNNRIWILIGTKWCPLRLMCNVNDDNPTQTATRECKSLLKPNDAGFDSCTASTTTTQRKRQQEDINPHWKRTKSPFEPNNAHLQPACTPHSSCRVLILLGSFGNGTRTHSWVHTQAHKMRWTI